MSLSSSIQSLTAAFSFGILLQAATGALFIFYKGHGGKLSQDGRRLVLILFLSSAALWALISFFNLMVTTAQTTCQALLIFSTSFDQLARVSVEQFLLWALCQGTKASTSQLILQGILGIRFVAGIALVALTRPDFAPVCVASTSILPVAIIVLALEAVIIGVLVIRENWSSRKEQGRALIFSILAFAVWTGMSVPMMLGKTDIELIIRTTLPAAGLLIVVGIITIFSVVLLIKAEEKKTTPEAQSPFITPSPPATREVFNERERVGDGSPNPGHNYSNSGSLFVVNPSSTPRSTNLDSTSGRFHRDSRGFTKLSGEVTVQTVEVETSNPSQSRGPGYRGSSGIFPASFGGAGNAPVMAPQIQPARTATTPNLPTRSFPRSPLSEAKKPLFPWSKTQAKPTVRGRGISGPVANNNEDNFAQPFAKIPTIDLATAAANERERRQEMLARSRLVNSRESPSQAGKDDFSESVVALSAIPGSRSPSLSNTTSASLSPGHEEIRRRSPRSSNSFERTVDEKPPVPLQRKPTIGLPTNPRVVGNRISPPLPRKEQTVMLINEIVYDNPTMVKDIMDSSAQLPKTAGKMPDDSYSSTHRRTDSIIHRPRPIKREDSEKDRHIFPSEHRRSKSVSSIALRKSLFGTNPGNPMDLPPLPPPPTSAMNLRRLLPNETKSMTFDEKIELLFPAPPGVPSIQKRRSSVPSLPRPSPALVADVPQQPDFNTSNRDSKRTTMSSFGFTRPNSPQAKTEGQIDRTSGSIYRTIADNVGETWLPGVPAENIDARNSVTAEPEELSVNEDRKSVWTEASVGSSQDDTTSSYWGSVHSEIPPVDLAKARQTARPTIIKRSNSASAAKLLQEVPSIEYNDQESVITVMFDADDIMEPILSEPTECTELLSDMPNWHRRIGDELPTFSERNANIRVRKMPPPPPLLLDSNGRGATVLVRTAEPSPIDSPEHAIKEIQAQLKKFEAPNRDSVESVGGRFRLLENLEKEMGQQEDQWRHLQSNDRDSMSLIMTPQASVHSEHTLSRQSSQKSIRSSRLVPRQQRIKSGAIISTNSSGNSRTSLWQRRLAEAQDEYLEHAPALPNNRKTLNFLSISKTGEQLGSPTPPDSIGSSIDLGSESESDSVDEEIFEHREQIKNYLWQSAEPLLRPAASGLWNGPSEVTVVRAVSPTPPAIDLRPAQRKGGELLTIESSKMWTKPRSSLQSRAVTALWGSKPVRPNSIVTRPVTQRPQRKSKRITILPDIVESPVPLPNKRDTLGIFSFPWGEKSDTAQYQPTLNASVYGAGPVLNPSLQARSEELEPNLDDYSASFFDDCDFDSEEDSDLDYAESDDEFDETTLWEIASLLNSSDVPSKNSLLPASVYKAPEKMTKTDNEKSNLDEGRDHGEVTIVRPLSTPSRPSLLWTGERNDAVAALIGLPQPRESDWLSLIVSTGEIVRSKPRVLDTLPIIESTELWSASVSSETATSSWSMWQAVTTKASPSRATMWSPVSEVSEVAPVGLFSVKAPTAIRTTAMLPAALTMTRKSRPTIMSLSPLASSKLWSDSLVTESEHDWISESSVRPESPSGYSTATSGQTSPASDSSSIKSNSTMASSVWGPAGSAVEMGARSAKGPPSQTPVVDAKPASKLPVRQLPKVPEAIVEESVKETKIPAPIKAKAPFRESKVLSARDIFESKAAKYDKAPVKTGRLFKIARQSVVPVIKAPRKPVSSRSAASAAEWDKELEIAILKSTPRSVRQTASPAVWSPELNKTTVKSEARLQRQVVSPAMWKSELNVAIIKSMPRLQRFTASPEMWASALEEACGGKTGLMWTPSTQQKASVQTESLWSKGVPSKATAEVPLLHAEDTPARKAPGQKSLALPVLESATFWQAPQTVPVERNWLTTKTQTTSTKVDSLTWSPAPKIISAKVEGPMWSKNAVFDRNAVTLFTPVSVARRAPTTELATLQSNKLWKATQAISAQHNWLTSSTKITKITSLTWSSAQRVEAMKVESGMWSRETTSDRNVPALFSPISGSTRSTTAFKTTELATLESAELWKTQQTHSSERDWLATGSKTTITRAINIGVNSLLWTPIMTTSPVKVDSSLMWSPNASFDRCAPTLLALSIEGVSKKGTSTVSLELPKLESTQLWQGPVPATRRQNWLTASSIDKSKSSSNTKSLTWTSPIARPAKTATETAMWSTGNTFDRNAIPSLEITKESTSRKSASVTSATKLATLESADLWKSIQASTKPINWLVLSRQEAAITRSSQVQTWTKVVKTSTKNDSMQMWTKPIVIQSIDQPELFSHLTSQAVKKIASSSQAALPSLTSDRLFESKIEIASQNVDWLHATSKKHEQQVSISQGQSKPVTWAPAMVSSVKSDGPMWQTTSVIRTVESDLFSNPHTAPWDRKERESVALPCIESTQLWRSPAAIPTGPTNWLLKTQSN
ncbi:hypothetical protein HYFRA_00002946 [Hymenoscyphus fraxineus]|uniref:Uncharacterized protein n=1 Tax=Hymenoscyphus fraxineus TaxID=746836 RepID=A0A9N9PP68_9HELO|nr:hypothetical protein HYFRA_00002946 [Hymenoscyphus fraxineus]